MDANRTESPVIMGRGNIPSENANWRGRKALLIIQGFFLLVSLVGLDKPFLSTHHERQNQTYDTARHVFHEGWSAVITPRATFSLPGYEQQPFTVIEQEVPFHGLLGWPFALLFGHEKAVVRLVSCVFGLVSIFLLFEIIRFWLPPLPAVFGAGIWASAPLVLQFGQVPMPDILCTTGILAAFWFAVRGKLVGASACFLFAILSKSSVIVYGLPVLCALLVQRNCSSWRDIVKISIFWGAAPLLGLIGWVVLVRAFSPPTPWTLLKIFSGRGDFRQLLQANFYLMVFVYLFVTGLGVLGSVSIAAAAVGAKLMNSKVKTALLISNLVYLFLIIQKMAEPQYFVPLLAWAIVACCFGVPGLWAFGHGSRLKEGILLTLLGAHIGIAGLGTYEFKAARTSGYKDLETAAHMLPPDARVIVLYRHYGASPAIWLDRNVIALQSIDELKNQWPDLLRVGFTHLVILDVEHRYDLRSGVKSMLAAARRVTGLWNKLPARNESLSQEADPTSNLHIYCDDNFKRLFQGNHIALYLLPTVPPATARK